MAKRDLLKEQLKKAAKKRSARNSALAQQSGDHSVSPSRPEHSESRAGIDVSGKSRSIQARGSTTTRSVNVIVDALLSLDLRRDDLDDRAILVGLKSVLRGYAGAEPNAAAVYQVVVEAKRKAEIQPRALRSAIDELISIVTAYGAQRETPRAALTYLHSISS